MDCTAMGASPPTGTLPTLICRVFLRIIMVRDYTRLLFFLHPSFVGRANAERYFFAAKDTRKIEGTPADRLAGAWLIRACS
jgi:hypothetical protein